MQLTCPPLIRTLYPDGTETRTVYDNMGRSIWTTDRFASGTSYNATTGAFSDDNASSANATYTIYDSLGRVVGTERCKDVVVVIQDDPNIAGTAVLMTVPPILSQLIADGKRLSTSNTVYDGSGRVAETVNADGLRSGTIYYDNGQVRYGGILKSALAGDWWSSLPANPVAGNYFDSYSTYEYDKTDSLPTGAVSYDKVTDALGHVTKTYKDVLGRVVRTVYDDGSFAETQYGYFADLPAAEKPAGVSALTYTISTRQRASGTSATVAMQTINYYDPSGRLVAVMQPDNDGDGNFATGQTVWKYQYDVNGNQTSQIDPRSGITNAQWNPTGRTIETTFEYDELGRRIRRTLPDGQVETWTYDDFGRTLTHSDFKGQTTAYEYDPAPTHGGRMEKEYRFAAGVAAIDSSGNILTANAAERTEYGYDSLGRQDDVKEYVGATLTRHTTYGYDPITGGQTLVNSPEGIIRYAYDPATGRKTRMWTDNNDNSYGYDDQGRLKTVTVTKLNGQDLSAAPLVTTYAYDAVGDLDITTEDNGTASTSDDLVHDYGYDSLNRLTSEVVTRGSTTVFSQTYVLSADGQRESSTETSGGVTTFTDWQYDAWNRLTSEFRDVGNGSVGNTVGVNTPNSTGDYYTSYTFDPVGNRLSKQVDDYDDAKDQTITSRYVFAAGDAIGGVAIDSSLIGKVSGNDWLLGTTTTLNGGSTTRYEYDKNGSTTATFTGTQTTRFVWDLRNRMTGYDANGDGDTNDNGDATLSYDHDGTRVRRAVVGGDSTDFLQDKLNPSGYSQILEEKKNGSLDRSYVNAQSVLGQATGTNIQWIVADGHGSTRLLLNADGTVAQSYAYDDYGNAIGFDPALAQTYVLYTNQVFDPIMQQYVLRARYYNQAIGEFSSFDSYENGGHKYLYANANPINNSDPSGNTTLVGTLVTSSIIGGLTGMIVGGIRGGVRGAIGGMISGAIFAPVVTLGAVGLGLGIAAATGISTTAGLFTSFALTTAGSFAWNAYDYATAKNEREKLAAGVSMIFTLGFAAYGSYKFSEIPSLPTNAPSGGGLFPNSLSNWGVWLSESMAGLRGERVVAREVTIDTPNGVRVRVDLVVKTITGALKFIDAKFGAGARFTENQQVGYPEIAKSGGTIAGGNGASAGLPAGTRIGPTQVQVDTWNGANP